MPSSIPRLTVLAALGLMLAGCGDLAFLPDLGLGSVKHLAASETKVDTTAARDMISNYRTARGLKGVAIDPLLERVAQDQALAMAEADTLSHTIAGSLMTRLDSAGVPHTTAIENVSAGYDSLASAFAGWRQSPPHDANLLAPNMRRMGIASATAPGSKYRIYWALVMTD
jgi:uncharacterized protein YkwD